jgi:hypothetical protein
MCKINIYVFYTHHNEKKMDLSSVVPSQQGKEKIIVNGYLMVKDKNQ